MAALISARNLSLSYDTNPALDQLNFDIEQGSYTCIMGSNGSGKSTLASILAALVAPDEGTLSMFGLPLFKEGQINTANYQAIRRKISLVSQNPDDQIVASTLERDVAFGPENMQLEQEKLAPLVEAKLRSVALLHLKDQDPNTLSGGQKQRLALASALATNPELLILDEPTALLDVRSRSYFMELIAKLRALGLSIIHITHHIEEALSADRVILLKEGRLAREGRPQELFLDIDFSDYGLEEPFALKLSRALQQYVAGLPLTLDENELCESLAKHLHHTNLTFDSTTESLESAGPTLIEAKQLHLHYPQSGFALKDLDFSLAAHKHIALLGAGGSGKSSLIKLFAGLLTADSGELTVLNTALHTKRGRRKIFSKVGYVMQQSERQLFAKSVLEDVSFGPQNLGKSKAEAEEIAAQCLDQLGLSHKAAASPFTLSGGQRRLAAIAGVLALTPQLLLLDEPTAGLDQHSKSLLQHCLTGFDCPRITITHNMDEAARADLICCLDAGQIQGIASAKDFFALSNQEKLRHLGLGLPTSLKFAQDLYLKQGIYAGEPLTFDELLQNLKELYYGA